MHRYIGLASCVFLRREVVSYEHEVERFLKYDELGIYNYWGEDEASTTREIVCDKVGDPLDCVFSSLGSYALPIKSMMYNA